MCLLHVVLFLLLFHSIQIIAHGFWYLNMCVITIFCFYKDCFILKFLIDWSSCTIIVTFVLHSHELQLLTFPRNVWDDQGCVFAHHNDHLSGIFSGLTVDFLQINGPLQNSILLLVKQINVCWVLVRVKVYNKCWAKTLRHRKFISIVCGHVRI